ncbi:hypothetical protein [Mycobacterium sp. 1245801.1]|uniref:hypothetical protein n=1 Tax=Mycobacterium sp. 1245801.1 TaxID=1834075 RepID=UPI000B2F239A|nr:hypothetical protein [Mycobacterium sp. 1245801.1]
MDKPGWACDLTKWLIVCPKHTPNGKWRVCPPLRDHDGNQLPGLGGVDFDTGAEALATFASGGAPLRAEQLTEACRPHEWVDQYGSRWFYDDGYWYWGDNNGRYLAGDEADVAEIYPWCGPYTRITGPGIPA